MNEILTIFWIQSLGKYSVSSVNIIHTYSYMFVFIGFENKEFSIFEYSDARKKSIDLSQSIPSLNELYKVRKFAIYLLGDTCIITKEETIPNNEIMLGVTISQKRVGSYLAEELSFANDE